jgi:hypothetical protein
VRHWNDTRALALEFSDLQAENPNAALSSAVAIAGRTFSVTLL